MLSIILDAASDGALELISAALRDQSQPTYNKKWLFFDKPPTSKMLEAGIEVLACLPIGADREAEVKAARRIGDCADSKDAAPFFKQFTINTLHVDGKTMLGSVLDGCRGDHLLFLPDMAYFYQRLCWHVLEAHGRLDLDVVAPVLNVRYPPIVLEGESVSRGRDGRQRHSKLGRNSCGPLGYLLDNDCEDEFWVDDSGNPNPIACASYKRSFLERKSRNLPIEHDKLMLTAFSVGVLNDHVVHLRLPWNSAINAPNNDSASQLPLFVSTKRGLFR